MDNRKKRRKKIVRQECWEGFSKPPCKLNKTAATMPKGQNFHRPQQTKGAANKKTSVKHAFQVMKERTGEVM